MESIHINFNNIFKGLLKSKIILQAILVGLISGGLVVLFKLSITELFEFIQKSTSHIQILFPLIKLFLFSTSFNDLISLLL